MIIGGLQKTTLIDFPGKIAASIFTVGCNFRCGYCHNPELVLPKKNLKLISEETILNFLKKRIGQLEGVCISGGEPTIQPDLIEFIKKIKAMGYLIKLDTQGSRTEVLEKIIEDKLVDYFAMDIKTALEDYNKVTSLNKTVEAILSSIKLIMNSGIDYEFRTTTAHPIVSLDKFDQIGKMINGAKRYFIQNYVKAKKQLSPLTEFRPFTEDELISAKEILKKYVQNVEIR